MTADEFDRELERLLRGELDLQVPGPGEAAAFDDFTLVRIAGGLRRDARRLDELADEILRRRRAA